MPSSRGSSQPRDRILGHLQSRGTTSEALSNPFFQEVFLDAPPGLVKRHILPLFQESPQILSGPRDCYPSATPTILGTESAQSRCFKVDANQIN